MAKKNFIGQHTALSIVIIVVVAFVSGFVLARAKYKPQLNITYNMVMEREGKIADLQAKVDELNRAVLGAETHR